MYKIISREIIFLFPRRRRSLCYHTIEEVKVKILLLFFIRGCQGLVFDSGFDDGKEDNGDLEPFKVVLEAGKEIVGAVEEEGCEEEAPAGAEIFVAERDDEHSTDGCTCKMDYIGSKESCENLCVDELGTFVRSFLE